MFSYVTNVNLLFLGMSLQHFDHKKGATFQNLK